jgi:hypothetical protein
MSSDQSEPHGTLPAGPPRKPLIVIMGVQRSGTTALFNALANAPGVSARHESKGDEIYDDYFLRPEPEIRAVLHSLPGTVLLKPVRESERRTPLEVAEEYCDYDLRIIWLYRDPVNAFHSYVRFGWCEQATGPAFWFAKEWDKRNMEAVGSAKQLGKRLLVVRYEDLTTHRLLVRKVAEVVGLRVSGALGEDSSGGRRSLPEELQTIIDDHTLMTRGRLDGLRSIRPTGEESAREGGVVMRLRGWLGAMRGKHLGQPRRSADGPSPVSSILCNGDYEELFHTVDVGPLYARWRRAGPVRRDLETGGFVGLGYEACRAIQAASLPLARLEPWPWMGSGEAARRVADLEAFFARRRHDLRRHIIDQVQAACAGLPLGEPHDFVPCLSALADRVAATWLQLPAGDDEACSAALRCLTRPLATAAFVVEWETIPKMVEKTGLIFALRREGLLLPGETRDFVQETCLPIYALPVLVENTLAALGDRPDAMERVRAYPSLIRPALDEAIRLTPIFLGIKRLMTRPLAIAGLELPTGGEVDLLVGAANRDPDAFPDPDRFSLDRRSPPPFILENEDVPISRFDDERRQGCDHLVLGVAAIVLERLLSGPRPPRTQPITEMRFQHRSDGSCTQCR